MNVIVCIISNPPYILGVHLHIYIQFLRNWRSRTTLCTTPFTEKAQTGSWWQLCTLLAFCQPASLGKLFQKSWRSSHICWALVVLLFLHSAVQLIPNHLIWVEVGWLWRPGHLMQHCITLLLGQIALTQPGGVLGHCPVEKQMIVGLSTNQMGWRITAECCGSHAG